MARNIEIKAKLSSITELLPRVRTIATEGPTVIHQIDTFFAVPEGRLKLRQFDSQRGELIFYRRSNVTGPKESFYIRTSTAEPEPLTEILRLALGTIGRVEKIRTLFMVGRTRIHLDQVEGLGEFLELEVVMREDETPEAGEREANQILKSLGIGEESLIAGAYLDLQRE